MTIKEIETLSGMDQANIRFYEREGLIAPKRMDNGYRNYSKDDLQILLRIKLLRSLHISLNEIKALKDGIKDLSDTLSKQISSLDQEKQDASYAQNVCRAMQEDRTAFADLDAKKYLDGINREMKETGSSYFTFKGDEFPQVFHPWRRYFARFFDMSMYNILWSAFLAFAFHVNLATRSNLGNFFDFFIAIVIMLALEPLCLHSFGTTPGKAIFGLRIETPDGRLLSYGEGLDRTWGVIGIGMGYNIPIYNLVRLWKSYSLCSENEAQPWDESISYTIKDTKWYRSIFYIGAYAAVLAALFTIISAQQLPPNRGDLTIAEFAENYNYYAKFFDINFGNEHLDENGKWVKNDLDGSVYIEIGHTEKPEYNFTIENEYVTGVSFEIEIKNSKVLLSSYDTEMFLASLAFTGAQKEMKLYSKIPIRIGTQIKNKTFEDFHFIEAGITFTCDIEHSGYWDAQSDFLFSAENATETFFSLNFLMNKIE